VLLPKGEGLGDKEPLLFISARASSNGVIAQP